ncbi:reverse transcriptase [Senna tora]|uniref:Reverse transcriptase n=1 Tax=Senna tora TaxID=362788 RepID=A0A834WKZ2_9FABA|nr:reverse transcriptase [Senna tora]
MSLGLLLEYDEIKGALWDLKPFKVPGVDGFQPGFYKKRLRYCG